MSRAAVAVVLSSFIAGCSGFVQRDSPETVTPAAVPTDAVGYPPGVSDDAGFRQRWPAPTSGRLRRRITRWSLASGSLTATGQYSGGPTTPATSR